MTEGVVSDTAHMAGKHPFWIAGGVVGLVLLFWLLSSGKTPAAPQAFTYSYGPSDAQVQAGTALAIQQAAGQSAVAIAGIQADASKAVNGDYFNYLATNSTNQVDVAQIASKTALGTAGYAAQTAQTQAAYGAQTAQTLAAYNASTQQTQAAYGAQTALGVAAYAAQTSQVQANYQTQTAVGVAAQQAWAQAQGYAYSASARK